jgi:hypothetical protein
MNPGAAVEEMNCPKSFQFESYLLEAIKTLKQKKQRKTHTVAQICVCCIFVISLLYFPIEIII